MLQEGRAQDAVPRLELALTLDPKSVPAQINLGGAYIMTGRHREAIPLLEAARDAEPENAMIWMNLGAAYLGVAVVEEGSRFRIHIPAEHHIGHEAEFGKVTEQFLKYLDGEQMPAWEKPNTLAKYYINTQALKLCRQQK